MYLIILLGVVGKLALVSGECDLGTPKLKNVDWNELTGNWYFLYHTSNKPEENVNCARSNYANGDNKMITSIIAYNNSRPVKEGIYGRGHKLTTNVYFDVTYGRKKETSFRTGKYLLLAIERDSYFIITLCPKQGGNRNAYIEFRERNPDKATLEKAFKAFNETGLDASQLVKWEKGHCHW